MGPSHGSPHGRSVTKSPPASAPPARKTSSIGISSHRMCARPGGWRSESRRLQQFPGIGPDASHGGQHDAGDAGVCAAGRRGSEAGDYYALACVASEFLTGASPEAVIPATATPSAEADFYVQACRTNPSFHGDKPDGPFSYCNPDGTVKSPFPEPPTRVVPRIRRRVHRRLRWRQRPPLNCRAAAAAHPPRTAG